MVKIFNPLTPPFDETLNDSDLTGLLDDNYLRLDASNDPLTGILNTQIVQPNLNTTYDLGSSSLNWRTLFLQNNGGNVITLPNSAALGTTTNYTVRTGGGGSTNNDFTFLFDDASGVGTNNFNVNLGATGSAASFFKVISGSDILNISPSDPATGTPTFSSSTGFVIYSSGVLSFIQQASSSSINFGDLLIGGTNVDFNFFNNAALATAAKYDNNILTTIGGWGFGNVSLNSAYFVIRPANFTANASTDISVLRVNGATITIPTGTTALGTCVRIMAPIFSATGTLTTAASLYINSAPSGASSNYAFFVDGGTSRFDGAIDFSSASGTGNIITDTTTGTKIGTATSQKLGFFNATPVAQPSVYIQTYSTADKTHANLTSSDLTGITSSTTGSALAEPSAGYTQSEMQQNFRRIQDQFNNLKADVTDLKQLVNSMIDDFQALGLLA